MPLLLQVAIGLVTAGASFVLGVAWRRGLQSFRARRARRFWRPVLQNTPLVVLSRFASTTEFEPSGLVGVGDARALQELTSYCREIGIPEPILAYDGSMTGDQLRNDLILLGGPDSNQITRLVLEKHAGTIGLLPSADGIVDGDQVLRPVLREDEVVGDCGVLLRITSPFWPDRKVVIAAGAFGWGTWAAIRLTKQPDFLAQSEELSDFECSFETDVVIGTPQVVRIRTLRPVGHGGPRPSG